MPDTFYLTVLVKYRSNIAGPTFANFSQMNWPFKEPLKYPIPTKTMSQILYQYTISYSFILTKCRPQKGAKGLKTGS